jgi:predicted type IV restriction endonuclease
VARQKLDRETRKTILNARSMIEAVAKMDGNEAETRKRVDRIFELVMGYDTFKHISREYAVHGVGDTEHCDFAIQIDNKESAVPTMLVELKRVNIDLMQKHLKQAASYAINIGCEWALLTNGKEWKLYHISFAQPPQTKLIDSWNLINDEPAVLAEKFGAISYKSLKKGYLSKLWEKSNVLTARNILKVILSEESITLIRRQLKKATDVLVSPEDIVSAIRRLLNEAAMTEMSNIKITISEKKPRTRKSSTEKGKQEVQTPPSP